MFRTVSRNAPGDASRSSSPCGALRTALAVGVCALLLAGCGSGDDDDAAPSDDVPTDGSPIGTPDDVPGGGSGENPGGTPGETPDGTPDESPDGTPGGNTDGTPAENPDGTPDETPDGTPDETPDETPDGTPDETPDGTPVETPDGTPDGNPDDTQAGTADEPFDGQRFAYVSGNTPTFDAGQFERFTLGEEIVPSGTQPAASSDIRVATDGGNFYQVGRFGLDSLTRFDPLDLETPVWQYSVNGEESGANPYDIVFASETKAYVIRYGSPLVWIVDPTADDEAGFKIGEIDLSAYDDDGVPETTGAAIVDGRLYVVMQRLENFLPLETGYVAVIDTETDTEIDTATDVEGLPGIALETRNPGSIAYLPESGDLLVVSQGNSFESPDVPGDPYTGGLELIDLETLETEILLDDGSADDNIGYTVDALVVSPEKGYVLTQAGFGSTTLRTFDPRTGLIVDESVAGLSGRDLSLVARGPEGRVWVGGNDHPFEDEGPGPGFALLDPASDEIVVERVSTQLNPSDIVFVDGPATAE